MFKSFKAKLLGFVGMAAVFASSANAEVLTADQKTQLTTAVTSGAQEYFGVVIAIIGILIPIAWAIRALFFAKRIS